MAPKMCDYPGCPNKASLMRCYRCNRNAACEQHSRKEPSLGGRYICFTCINEIDTQARLVHESKMRESELATQREQDRLARYVIICPVCFGTGGWQGKEKLKIQKYYVNEAGSNGPYKVAEDRSYFEPCYLCNTNNSGVIGKVTEMNAFSIDQQKLIHPCPLCKGAAPEREVQVKIWLDPGGGGDYERERERVVSPPTVKTCKVCKGRKLVTETTLQRFYKGPSWREWLFG